MMVIRSTELVVAVAEVASIIIMLGDVCLLSTTLDEKSERGRR